MPQQTTVWVGYDKDALYFAFRCDDPEPSRIKTSVTRRDNIWSDDWVGLSLDALGTGQTSYHLLVNPSGIQLDMINTLAGNEDTSPDWIWTSAGSIDDKGYTVEIRLPLQTIRFGGGADVQMGILFWRRISRTGVSVSWPALEPGSWVFQKHSKLGFSNLEPRPTRELIPSAVFTRNQERVAPGEWGEADADSDFGISAKWGLSSTITLDATVNPDFSQVESDAFQVEVNQRFPIFFSEKRPFFMEGAGLFNLAGNGQGDASMLYAVHTRRIVDPIFGAKLTGSSGRVTFGSLTAVDQSPGRTIDPLDRLNGEEKLFQVARAQVRLNTGSLRRRDGDVHRAGRPHQCRRGRRSQPAFQGLEQPDGVRARLEHRRWRRRGAGHRAAGELRIQLATGRRVEPDRALRPRVRDGHRVHEPCRLHVGLGLHRLQLLSRQGPLPVGPQDFTVHLRCRADAIASRAATTTSSSAASV